MNLSKLKFAALILMIGFFSACNSETQKTTQTVVEESRKKEVVGVVANVLSKEEQDALTPDMVIQSLKEGNERFMRNDLTARDHSA